MYKNLHICLMNKHGQIYWGGGVHSIAFYCIPLLFGLGPSLKSRSRLRCMWKSWRTTNSQGWFLWLTYPRPSCISWLIYYELLFILNWIFMNRSPALSLLFSEHLICTLKHSIIYIHRMYTRIAKLTQFTKH